MTPAQPIFHALGLLVETVQREEEALWSHRCSAPVEAPGLELVEEGGQVWVLGSLGKDDKSCLGVAHKVGRKVLKLCELEMH